MSPPIKILFIFFVFQVSFFLTSNAQSIQLEWVKTIGAASSSEHGKALVIDSNKSVVVTGGFYSTVDFNPGPGISNMTSNGSMDIYIARYDSSGNFLWAKQLGGTDGDDAKDIEIDKDGNILLLGMFQATVDFDPGPGVQNLTTTFASSFLLKLDNNGNFIWVKPLLYGTNKFDIDEAGNIILGGEFVATQDFDPGPGVYTATAGGSYFDLFVVKLGNAGNFSWMKQVRNMGTSEHQQFGLETDPDGSIYFAGNFTSTMDFDPGTNTISMTSAGSDDAFLLKLDSQGNFGWAKQFGGGGSDKIFGLEVDKNGNVFSTGQFFNAADFDPGPATYSLTASGTSRSCFISKLDKNGNFIYAKNFQSGDTFGQSLAIDSSNNLYIAGGFRFTVDFDPGAGVYNIADGGLFTVKLDTNGNFAWAAGYSGGPAVSFESIYSAIKVDILKNVYFTGSFPHTVDFDPNPSVYNATAGDWDIYLHKLSQCRNTLNIINVQQTCSNYTLNSITYTSSGVYYQTLANSVGCDSIIQLNLARGDKLSQLNITTCDAYLWNGALITNSGIYRDTFNLASGCDSVVQLNLTITRILTNLSETACGSYMFNGTTLSASGIYRDTIRLANGCDSVVALNLVINENPLPILGNDTTLCKGETFIISPGTFNEYLWSNNTTGNSLPVTDTGTYWVRVTGANNCNATDTIHIKTSNQCIDCGLNIETKLYPNPFKGFIIVDKNHTVCEVRMNLYNALGQLLIKDILINDGLNNIPVENLSAGMYFYKFHAGGNTLLTGKILKQ